MDVFDEKAIRLAMPLHDGNLVHEMIKAIEGAFVQYAAGNARVAPVQHLEFKERGSGDFCVKSGFMTKDDVFVVKVGKEFRSAFWGGVTFVVLNTSLCPLAKFKVAGGGFQGVNASSGMMSVFSQITGQLEGLLVDNGYLTDVRTAIAGAIYTKHFAPENVCAIGIAGYATVT